LNAHNFPLAPGLWLVGVPIGTARDITLRALDVLASADILAAEDTRSLRKLLEIHGIALQGRRMVSLHDHSGKAKIDILLDAIHQGQSVAYASEAGMPLIADPGFELVRAAQAANLAVTSAPGLSAVTTALALAGLGTDSFYFGGFLPNAKGARRKALGAVSTVEATLVFFESPKRISATLRDAAEVLGPREARICRELTKKFEEVRQGTLDELAEQATSDPPRGEIVLLIGRPEQVSTSPEALELALREALTVMSVRDAAQHVADMTGAAKRDLYQMALLLKS